VIDIVGDSAESEVCSFSAAVCAPLQAARAAALAGGVTTINALWIDDRDFFGDDHADQVQALPYGQNERDRRHESVPAIVEPSALSRRRSGRSWSERSPERCLSRARRCS
jgi:hypothetical protein